MNRLLIVQSYFPELEITGQSQSDDVKVMRDALQAFARKEELIPVGHAGTTLRFMAFRVSREPGKYNLVGHPRLFARPQQELVKVLAQLGVEAVLKSDRLVIQSQGWSLRGDTLMVSSEKSSQFASGVLLNSWNLDFDLYVSQGSAGLSEGYWRMTTKLMETLGLKIDYWDQDFRVRKQQRPSSYAIEAESDLSSMFAIAAIAAVNGSATFLEVPQQSLQPDLAFLPILQAMGVPVARANRQLKVERAKKLTGIAVNLRSSPDLFPVLVALCALAEGESHLYGAPQLVHKESDRIAKMAELLTKVGREFEIKPDGIKILGSPPPLPGPCEFDCENDHRLAFAAAVLKSAGYPLRILNPQVVTKSFPEFWSILGWTNPSI